MDTPLTCTATVYTVEMESGEVENVNVTPPSELEGIIEAELVDETVKSDEIPVVAPDAPDTTMVQLTVEPIRTGEPYTQVIDEEVVGVPYTINEGEPFVMETPPTATMTKYAALLAGGVVENVYVEPPFSVVGVMLAELEEETEKSDASPVVGPFALETLMVHEMGLPARCGFPETQESDDAIDGTP